MIDLTQVLGIIEEVQPSVAALNGRSHDESEALTESKASPGRHDRAAVSRELQFLATRFELAAALVRHEYWASRGASDHIHAKGV